MAPGGSATARLTALSRIEVGELAAQRLRVVGSADLNVVVEIDVDITRSAGRAHVWIDQLGVVGFAAGAPGADARGPPVERIIGIAADVELFRAVQPQVKEIGGD